ncbi:MAG: hypothetical protein N3C63_01945 [Rhodocyclaceae bacterium]|nr:hypothetical protein [Rhodocyclaceae bacterium]
MAAPSRLIFAALAVQLSCAAFAQSAWEQAKEMAGPNYRPPELPTPGMQCVTCGSRSAPQSAPQTSRPAPRPTKSAPATLPLGATMGMAIFGSILQQALSFDLDTGPDPAELARQEEARRQAEAEAKRRAAEEEARHRALVASLKAIPLPSSSATPPASSGLGLKALEALDRPQSSEALRETAALGWDTRDVRFAVRHRPLAVSEALPVHAPQTVCDASGCRWQKAGPPVAPRLQHKPTRHQRLEGPALVDLIAAGQKPQANPRDLVMARLLERPPDKEASIFAQLRRLLDKGRKTLWAIVWAWGGLFIDEFVPGGKQLMLMKDVYELADQSLSDAVKAAGWLGSIETEAPPEIVSVEEAAQPFLFRGVTENEKVAKEIKEGVTVVTEGLSLAKKLMEIWEVK